MMTYLLKWMAALLLGLLCLQSWGQALPKTFTATQQMDLREAYYFHFKNEEHGINATFTHDNERKATITVETKEGGNFKNCGGGSAVIQNILMYEAWVDQGTHGALFGAGNPKKSRYRSWIEQYCEHDNSTNTPGYVTDQAYFADWVINGQTVNTFFPYGKTKVDVTLKLTLEGSVNLSEIVGIKIPGIPELTGADFEAEIFAEFRVNGSSWQDLSNKTLSTTLGDRIDFRIPKSKVANINNATFNKLPGIWVARFGWDVMYYQTESVNPGDYKPFLGFDSQVHSVFFRRHEDYFDPDGNDGFKIQEEDWKDEDDFWTWRYTVPVRINSEKSQYSPLVNWEVTKVKDEVDPSSGQTYGKTQRHDQRRGSNLNLLSRWPNAFNENGMPDGAFTGTYPGPKYFVGLDPDEFVYVNRHDTEVTAGDGIDLLYVEGYPWHELLPQEQAMVDAGQNQQADGLALSYMVTAYQRQQSGNGNYPIYKGHEVEDQGLYIKSDGTPCTGLTDCFYRNKISAQNNSAAGDGMSLDVDGNEVRFWLHAESPQGNNDPGFYPSIVGTEWPAAWEKDVPYTLKGLQGLTIDKIQRFSLELQFEDELGYLHKTSINPSVAEADNARTSGKWTATFDMQGFGNYNITAYYKSCLTCKRVPIGGKELNLVELRFLAVNEPGKSWDGSKGPGAYWYMQDEIREYTVTKEQQLDFSIMDSDPHTFRPNGTEFYISNRAKAKRIPNDSLGTDRSYLKWYITSGIDERGWGGTDTYIGDGLNASHQFTSNGLYGIKVLYRDKSYVTHLIRVVDYDYNDVSDDAQKGKIVLQDPTANEASWLQESGHDPTGKKIASVENVLSHYTYTESSVRGKGTYDPENEFVAAFEWYDQNNYKQDPTKINFDHNNIFPSTWVRHTEGSSPSGKGVDAGKIITLNKANDWSFTNAKVEGRLDQALQDAPEGWNLRLPWIATTNTHGYQVRNNVKSVFGMQRIFNPFLGGLSGRGNLKYEDENVYKAAVSSPFPFDEQDMERQRFFEDLEHGRKILIDPAIVTDLTVKNAGVNKDGDPFDHFIASRPVNYESDFLKGADMSSIPNLEAKGITWGSGQSSVDPYELVSSYDMNVVRFRLWVDPVHENLSNNPDCAVPSSLDGTPYTYSSYEVVETQIQRAKAQGLKVLLDLHLSDTWTDPGANIIPSLWKSPTQSAAILGEKVYQYVHNTLEGLHLAAATPDYVQIGNETNGNILLSDEYEKLTLSQIAAEISVTEEEMNGNKYVINWDRNAVLFNFGLQAVRDFSYYYGVDTKTMLHIAGPVEAQWWIGEALSTTGRQGLGEEVIDRILIDYLGMSYYLGEPSQDISFAQLSDIITEIHDDHGLPTVIVETGFPRTYGWSDCSTNQMGSHGYRGNPDAAYQGRGFPLTTSNNQQKQFLLSLMNTLQNTPGGSGLLYWEPFWVGSNNSDVPSKDIVGSAWENMSFFTFEIDVPSESHNILAAGSGIEAFCEGNCPNQGGQSRMANPEVPSEELVEVREFHLNVYPNPNTDARFNIEYSLVETSDVEIRLMDMNGRVVGHYLKQAVPAGTHTLQLQSGREVSAGVYLMHFRVNGFETTQQLIVNK